MAVATRTVRVRFDGTVRGLEKATKDGARAVDGFQKQVKKSAAQIDIGGGLLDALGALPSQLKGAAIVAGAAIGALMAPAVGSAIIAGVLLVIGGGALAAGIAGAANHPKVIAAWQKFGDQAKKVFDKFSQPFVAPLARAAGTFGAALKRVEPTILKIGAAIAPVVDKLAPALASMAEAALPGILAAVQASVPLFDVLAAHGPTLGAAFAQFINALILGLPGAIEFMQGLLTVVELLLPKVGLFISGLALLGPKVSDLRDKASGLLAIAKEKVTGFWTEHIALRVEKFVPLVEKLGGVIKGIADQVLPAIKSAFNTVADAVKDNEAQFDTFLNAVRAVAGFIIEKVLPLLGPILSGVIQVLGFVISLVIRQFGMWIDTISAVVAAVKLWWETVQLRVQQIGEFFTALREKVATTIAPIINFIQSMANLMVWLADVIIGPKLAAAGAMFSWLYEHAIKPWWNAVTTAVSAVGDVIAAWWARVQDNFNRVAAFLAPFRETFRSVFAAIGGFISGAFSSAIGTVRGALNSLIDLVNRAVRSINDNLISALNKIPGVNFGKIPTLPKFHTGGIVPGSGEQLVVAKGGEGIFTAEQMAALGRGRGDVDVHVYVDGQEFRGMMRTEIRESNRGLRRAVLAGAGSR